MRLRLERRHNPGRLARLLPVPLAVLAGAAVVSLVILSAGASPRATFAELLGGAFGGPSQLAGTVVKAIPLMLCGLGLALVFRAGIWNIGAEGQLQCGAAAATWFALSFPAAPAAFALPAMVLLSMTAGALWAVPAGLLKWKLGVNEIIVTLLMNYIAINGVEFLIYGPWRDPATFGFPFTPDLGEGARLPLLFGTRIHAGLLLALVAAVALWFVMNRTRAGFQVRVLGGNPRAARYAGYHTGLLTVGVLAASGAMAGLAGMSEIAGLHHRLQPDFSPGYGYTAIIVAWLARLHPLAVPPAAILFGGLLTGADMVQITLRLPLALVTVLQGTVLLALAAGEFFGSFRIRLEPSAEKTDG